VEISKVTKKIRNVVRREGKKAAFECCYSVAERESDETRGPKHTDHGKTKTISGLTGKGIIDTFM
jgi:hypothetical protein